MSRLFQPSFSGTTAKAFTRWTAALAVAIAMTTGCATQHAPIDMASQVDLERFAGTWYVVGNIPTFIEKEAYNATEVYSSPDNGRIATTFTYNKGALDGPQKTWRPVAWVSEESNALWGMQFLWPFRAEYRILHVDADYQTTIVGRSARDYLWIMARTPHPDPADYASLVEIAVAQGYDANKIHKVPHNPPAG